MQNQIFVQKFRLQEIQGIPNQYKKSIDDLLPFEKEKFYDYLTVNKMIIEFLTNQKVKEIIKKILESYKNKFISFFVNRYISFIFVSCDFSLTYIPSFKKSGVNEFNLLFNNDENLDLTPTKTDYEINRILKKIT